MMRKIIHVVILLVLLGVGLFGMVRPASADAVYPTERLTLEPVGVAPLRSGSVVNTHMNGPMIYARETYHLNGALPNATYLVRLTIYLASPTCQAQVGPEVVMDMASLSTNITGNGIASRVVLPKDAEALAGLTVGGKWQVWNEDGDEEILSYQTRCTSITLD